MAILEAEGFTVVDLAGLPFTTKEDLKRAIEANPPFGSNLCVPEARVKRVYHRLAPFRLTTLVWGAQSVLELASGSLAGTGTTVGDELQFSLRKES